MPAQAIPILPASISDYPSRLGKNVLKYPIDNLF